MILKRLQQKILLRFIGQHLGSLIMWACEMKTALFIVAKMVRSLNRHPQDGFILFSYKQPTLQGIQTLVLSEYECLKLVCILFEISLQLFLTFLNVSNRHYILFCGLTRTSVNVFVLFLVLARKIVNCQVNF